MTTSKVLIAIPYHKEKAYALQHLMNRIGSFTPSVLSERVEYEVIMRWHLGEYGEPDGVKKQREYFRMMALAGDFTHLYFLGADTIPPTGFLRQLLAHDLPIVGGVYWGRSHAENGQPGVPVAWIHGHHFDGDNHPEQRRQQFLPQPMDGEPGLLLVDGMGMDAVLIRRDALEATSFLEWLHNDDDYPFYDKSRERGFECYIDRNVQCKHYYDSEHFSYEGKVFHIEDSLIEEIAHSKTEN